MTLATLFGMFHVVFEQAPDRLEAKVPPFVVHAGSVTRGGTHHWHQVRSAGRHTAIRNVVIGFSGRQLVFVRHDWKEFQISHTYTLSRSL